MEKSVIQLLPHFEGNKNAVTSGVDFYLIFILMNDDNNPPRVTGSHKKEPDRGVKYRTKLKLSYTVAGGWEFQHSEKMLLLW